MVFSEHVDSKIVNNYEYAIEKIANTANGSSNLDEMLKVINRYASDGWKVHTVYSNELGKNAIGFGGLGINSTYSEDIIIFERHVQYNIAMYDEKELLVTNYSEDFPIRFGTMCIQIPKNTNSFKVSLVGRSNKDIFVEALDVDIDFITIFNESIHIKDACFISVIKNRREFCTEFYEIEMNKNLIKLIKSAKIYVRKYIENGKTITVDNLPYTDINDEALNLRKRELFGQDYVGEFENLGDKWRCVCGKINSNKERVCSMCGRSIDSPDSNSSYDLKRLYEEASKRKSALEIKKFVTEYNKERNSEILQKIINELESIAFTERLYGNNPQGALKIIEKYIDKSK